MLCKAKKQFCVLVAMTIKIPGNYSDLLLHFSIQNEWELWYYATAALFGNASAQFCCWCISSLETGGLTYKTEMSRQKSESDP